MPSRPLLVFEIKHRDGSFEYVLAHSLIEGLCVLTEYHDIDLEELVESKIRHRSKPEIEGIFLEEKEEMLLEFIKRNREPQYIGS